MGIGYQIERNPDGCRVLVYGDNRQLRELKPDVSQELFNHSPTGFNFGYGGSGPAQLALALLFDVLGDRVLTLTCYQFFKWEVVAKWVDDRVFIQADEIRNWVCGWIQRQEDLVMVDSTDVTQDGVTMTTVHSGDIGKLASREETLLYLRSACKSWPDTLEKELRFHCDGGCWTVLSRSDDKVKCSPRMFIARWNPDGRGESAYAVLRK